MIQEEKDLLLKDLCARLPYEVKVCCYKVDYNKTPLLYDNETLVGVVGDNIITENDTFSSERVRPYLRPMSSMTKEEYIYLKQLNEDGTHYEVIDFCNERHLDYRGLIEKELALEAKDGMYSNKEE